MFRIKLFEKFITSRPIRKVMSRYKYKHSKRVANLTKELSSLEDVYNSALYHDFLERGGKIEDTKKVLSFNSYQLILALSHDEDEDTLESLKTSLDGKPQEFINNIVYIKLCDRTDNLKTRFSNDRLKNKYIKKSAKLIQFLYDSFEGDKSILDSFIEKHIFSVIPKMTEKITLNSFNEV
jgi:hypothetical protein